MPPETTDGDALFQRLFTDYQKPILNYAFRLLGDEARAEELVQDVFVRVYRNLGSLPADCNYRAWIYRVTTNLAYDQLRRRRIIHWLPLLERDHHAEGDAIDTLTERDAVQRALSALPDHYRSVLVLYSVQGYSVREISTMLDLSEAAIKTRLCRARDKFREVYGGSI